MSLRADQAFHFEVNADPDADSRNYADPDPQHCQKVQLFSLGIHHYTFIRILTSEISGALLEIWFCSLS
jgi:hypothetical protein